MTNLIKFIHIIVHSGVAKGSNEEEKLQIKYLNQGLLAGIVLFIPTLIFESLSGYLPAIVVDLLLVVLLTVCFLINRNGRYLLARNMCIIGLNLILLATNLTQGTQTGNYLIFIPLILLLPVLIKLKEKKWQIAFHMGFTLLCMLLSVLVSPVEGFIGGIAPALAAQMFKGSFLMSFGLVAILTYIVYNITRNREKELTAAREQAEAGNQIKMLFISNMSHELRTPLNAIIGTTNLLLLQNSTPQQKDQYEQLQYSSQQMLQLVNDVLDFSKIESGKIELENRAFNLQTFIKNIYNSFAPQFEEKGLYFNLLIDEASLNHTIVSDDLRLGQILNNLLSNALKFTCTGSVTLSLALSHLDDNRLQVHFEVADTGIGIKAEHIHAIFDSFVQGEVDITRKYGGTGLGLSISKKLCALFGSPLTVSSQPNKGSRFSFAPIFNVSAHPPLSAPNKQPTFKSLAGMRILIAEDNKVNMLIARKFLLMWGAQIVEAINGREAIEQCSQHPVHLALLDLEMPEVDGYTAITAIQKLQPNLPVFAFTATVFENMQTVLQQKGFTGYVLKPFAPKDLNELLYGQKELLHI